MERIAELRFVIAVFVMKPQVDNAAHPLVHTPPVRWVRSTLAT